VYDELVHGELTAYLTACQRQFDLIVAADTIIYFGDLAPVMSAALAALRPGGLLVFTLEEAVDVEPPEGFQLEPHGRYTHRREYVASLLAPHVTELSIERAELRHEGGVPVAGLVVRALKSRIGDGNA